MRDASMTGSAIPARGHARIQLRCRLQEYDRKLRGVQPRAVSLSSAELAQYDRYRPCAGRDEKPRLASDVRGVDPIASTIQAVWSREDAAT